MFRVIVHFVILKGLGFYGGIKKLLYQNDRKTIFSIKFVIIRYIYCFYYSICMQNGYLSWGYAIVYVKIRKLNS